MSTAVIFIPYFSIKETHFQGDMGEWQGQYLCFLAIQNLLHGSHIQYKNSIWQEVSVPKGNSYNHCKFYIVISFLFLPVLLHSYGVHSMPMHLCIEMFHVIVWLYMWLNSLDSFTVKQLLRNRMPSSSSLFQATFLESLIDEETNDPLAVTGIISHSSISTANDYRYPVNWINAYFIAAWWTFNMSPYVVLVLTT